MEEVGGDRVAGKKPWWWRLGIRGKRDLVAFILIFLVGILTLVVLLMFTGVFLPFMPY